MCLPTDRRKRGKCCINRLSALAQSAFVRHARLWCSYELMVSRVDGQPCWRSAGLTVQPWIYIDTHACAHSLPHVYIPSVVRTNWQYNQVTSSVLVTGYEPGGRLTIILKIYPSTPYTLPVYNPLLTTLHLLSSHNVIRIIHLHTRLQ